MPSTLLDAGRIGGDKRDMVLAFSLVEEKDKK